MVVSGCLAACLLGRCRPPLAANCYTVSRPMACLDQAPFTRSKMKTYGIIILGASAGIVVFRRFDAFRRFDQMRSGIPPTMYKLHCTRSCKSNYTKLNYTTKYCDIPVLCYTTKYYKCDLGMLRSGKRRSARSLCKERRAGGKAGGLTRRPLLTQEQNYIAYVNSHRLSKGFGRWSKRA